MTHHSWQHVEQLLSTFPDMEILRGPQRNQHPFSTYALHHLLEELGLTAYPLPIVQLVGSKGKGTVAWMVEHILRAHGWNTGLYQSPHLQTRQERILLNGQVAPVDLWLDVLQTLVESCPPTSSSITRFEMETALALELFVRADVDVVILEAGLGGKQDATSAVCPDVVGITSIELEHTDILGPQLADIAHHKASVARFGVPVVCAPLPTAAMQVVSSLCHKREAPLLCVGYPDQTDATFIIHNPSFHPTGCDFLLASRHINHALFPSPTSIPTEQHWAIQSSMLGPHIPVLSATAVAIATTLLESLGQSFDTHSLQSLQHLSIPGRLQSAPIPQSILLDTAHTPDSVLAALQACQQTFRSSPHAVLLGINEDKRISDILKLLASHTEHLFLVPNPGPRGCSSEQLLHILAQACPQCPNVSVHSCPDWLTGWNSLCDLLSPCVAEHIQQTGLALGSFALIGHIQQHLRLSPLPTLE